MLARLLLFGVGERLFVRARTRQPVAAGVFQGAQQDDNVTAVSFWERREGGHSAFCVAVADLPEQRAVALCLCLGGTQVRGRCCLASAVFLMTSDAGAHEALAAYACGCRILSFRIGCVGCVRWCLPLAGGTGGLRGR